MPAGRAKHVPQRRCAVCRTILPQRQLIRFARDEEGMWRLDPDGRKGGRGTWLCGNPACHDRKALGRAFRAQAAQVAQQLSVLAAAEAVQFDEERSRTEG